MYRSHIADEALRTVRPRKLCSAQRCRRARRLRGDVSAGDSWFSKSTMVRTSKLEGSLRRASQNFLRGARCFLDLGRAHWGLAPDTAGAETSSDPREPGRFKGLVVFFRAQGVRDNGRRFVVSQEDGVVEVEMLRGKTANRKVISPDASKSLAMRLKCYSRGIRQGREVAIPVVPQTRERVEKRLALRTAGLALGELWKGRHVRGRRRR